MPQMFGIPYPIPMPMPTPPPPPMYAPYPAYGYPYYSQQQQQPTVIVIDHGEKKKDEVKKDPPKAEPPKAEPPKAEPPKAEPPKPAQTPKPKGPQKPSIYTINGVIAFCLALGFGTGCIAMTYNADYERQQAEAVGDENLSDNSDYKSNRNIALGLGCITAFCFTIATMSIAAAGVQYKKNSKGSCCLDAFMIGGWIIFSLSFIYSLILIVLAWDPENITYPGTAVVGFIGCTLAWLLMLGYSELARHLK
jgi:hypothetical protein